MCHVARRCRRRLGRGWVVRQGSFPGAPERSGRRSTDPASASRKGVVGHAGSFGRREQTGRAQKKQKIFVAQHQYSCFCGSVDHHPNPPRRVVRLCRLISFLSTSGDLQRSVSRASYARPNVQPYSEASCPESERPAGSDRRRCARTFPGVNWIAL